METNNVRPGTVDEGLMRLLDEVLERHPSGVIAGGAVLGLWGFPWADVDLFLPRRDWERLVDRWSLSPRDRTAAIGGLNIIAFPEPVTPTSVVGSFDLTPIAVAYIGGGEVMAPVEAVWDLIAGRIGLLPWALPAGNVASHRVLLRAERLHWKTGWPFTPRLEALLRDILSGEWRARRFRFTPVEVPCETVRCRELPVAERRPPYLDIRTLVTCPLPTTVDDRRPGL